MCGKAQPDGCPGWEDGNSGLNFTIHRKLLGAEPSPMQYALASFGHSLYCKIIRKNRCLSPEIRASEKVDIRWV